MARVYVATNFHTGVVPRTGLVHRKAEFTIPATATLGFKGVFWSVFDEVFTKDDIGIDVRIGGTVCRVESVEIFVVKHLNFPCITDVQTRYLVLIAMETDTEDAGSTINNNMFSSGLNEQGFVKEVLDTVSANPGLEWIKSFRHDRDFPARLLYSHDGAVPANASAYAAFYFFGNLLLWQVERELSYLDIRFKGDAIHDISKNMLKIEQKIANLNRWTLTVNISNDPAVKAFTAEIRKKLGLKNKFDRLPALTEYINNYLTRATGIRRDKYTQRLATAASVIALLGIPIGFIAMVLAINPASIIVSDGMAALLSLSLLMSLGPLGIVALIAALLIAVLMSVLIDRG